MKGREGRSESDLHMRSRILQALTAAALACSVLVVPSVPLAPPTSVAQAAGSPDVSLAKEMPGEMLYGVPIPVSLVLTNDCGPDGFNALFTDVLPADVSYVDGSGSPAPTSVELRPNGTTVLIWNNVADMLTGAEVRVDYSIQVDTAEFSSGDTVTNSARAFVHSDPRTVPKATPAGGAEAGTSTGNDSASASTLLIPFELTKTVGRPRTNCCAGSTTSRPSTA